MKNSVEILRATLSDAEAILSLQKIAYQSEAELYGNYDILPLTQTIDDLKTQFKNHIVLKAVSGGTLVGTVRAYEEGTTCYIGRLAVHPDYQNCGIGTALMNTIETCFNSPRFELFTGSKSEKNIYLYKKLGYVIYNTKRYDCGGNIETVHMEKYRERST